MSVTARGAEIVDGHTRLGVTAGDDAVICWSLLCGIAKANIARRLAAGSVTATRWTKYALHHWYRQAGPGRRLGGAGNAGLRDGRGAGGGASHRERRTRF